MRIFFSVGEPSGDLHGANLIRDLRRMRPDVECVGFGGPRMQAAGCELLADLTQLAVMGIVRVLLSIFRFWRLLREADRYFRRHQVDAVVLIDYPGFNWWIARCAKARGIPVFYYGVPQMWAWAPWRVRKLRRLVDHVLCKLPFEEKWFRQRGCKAIYVGHPYFDEMQRQVLDGEFLDKLQPDERPLVTILPGSRTQEVVQNLPMLLRAAEKVQQAVPIVRFAVAGFNDKLAALASSLIEESGINIEVYVGRTPELIHAARCCMACSGSVSLELMYHAKPTVIVYRISRLTWLAQALVLNVKYVTLVNLLATSDIRRRTAFRPFDPDAEGAEPVPFPEYVTCSDKSGRIASHVINWLTTERRREECVNWLLRLRAQFARGGASLRAANYILNVLAPAAVAESQSPLAA